MKWEATVCVRVLQPGDIVNGVTGVGADGIGNVKCSGCFLAWARVRVKEPVGVGIHTREIVEVVEVRAGCAKEEKAC